MADELIDICDENMLPLGSAMKNLAHKTGLWHTAIHCWIVRPLASSGTLLFQKRGHDKVLFPDYLDITAAGHYLSGEEVSDGVREIAEEIGLSVRFDELISLGIKMDLGKTEKVLNREFCHVFLYADTRAPHEYTLDTAEVEGLVEISIDEGLALFAGESHSAIAQGIEWNAGEVSWQPVELSVTVDDFIPRVDPYYYKMFINAERYLNGYPHLAI